MAPLHVRLAAEAAGTALLLAVIVGSGIMAERLAGGNGALALLCNAMATGAGLVVLITTLGPISGAHLNPVVTFVLWRRAEIAGADAAAYAVAQVAGAIAGVVLAHAMFALLPVTPATTARDALALGLAEAVATAGLLATILLTRRARPEAVAANVGLYIFAAYWFTASTSFANPAVTIARSLTDTFTGIRPADVPLFLAGQAAGAVLIAALDRLLGRRTADGSTAG